MRLYVPVMYHTNKIWATYSTQFGMARLIQIPDSFLELQWKIEGHTVYLHNLSHSSSFRAVGPLGLGPWKLGPEDPDALTVDAAHCHQLAAIECCLSLRHARQPPSSFCWTPAMRCCRVRFASPSHVTRDAERWNGMKLQTCNTVFRTRIVNKAARGGSSTLPWREPRRHMMAGFNGWRLPTAQCLPVCTRPPTRHKLGTLYIQHTTTLDILLSSKS